MRATSGKAVFASLAIHAGVIAAVAHYWTMPAREAKPVDGCFGVCLFSPPAETPLLPEEDDALPAGTLTDTPREPEPEIEDEPATTPEPAPITVPAAEENGTQPPEPPAVPEPSRVIATQPPKPKPAAPRKASAAKTQPPKTNTGGSSAGGASGKVQAVASIPPQLRYKAAPTYRETAETRGKRHTVWLTLDVDERGRVVAVRVKRSCGFDGLDSAAAAAAKRYRFKPALAGGNAIPWKFDHAITFAP